MGFEGYLEELKDSLKQLPGVGEKSAQRMAFYLITTNKKNAIELAEKIKEAVNSIKRCDVCNMLSEESPCSFCSNPDRDDNILCVVEKTRDVYLIENTNQFKGRYFVLGALLSPLDGIGPKEINIEKLENRIKESQIKEVILALNPSSEGESTMSFISSRLKKYEVSERILLGKVTKLATGIPVGGDIEYSSSLTLANAISNRHVV